MIKTISILLFFLLSISVNAQNSELLKGKWIFKKALNKGIDNLGKETLNSKIINKMTFEFKSNGEFVAFIIGENMDGKWTFFKDSKKIRLDTGKEKLELLVIKLTQSELILKLGLGEFLMKKI